MRRSLSLAIASVLVASALLGATVALAQPLPPVWHNPVLAWPGTTDYLSKGVAPTSAKPGTPFVFKVKYAHPDGTLPVYVKVAVWNPNGIAVNGSPFLMTSDGTTTWKTGVLFSVSLPLSKVGTYSYRFTASDGGAIVQFPSTRAQGPLVNTPPQLLWVGTPGYKSKGVMPATGTPGTTFSFQVKYKDPDGPAQAVSVSVWRPDGLAVNGSPFAMAKVGTTFNWATGVTYAITVPLSATGTFTYRFSAGDGYAFAYLPSATGKLSGPSVGPGPQLVWAGTAGYRSKGVVPDTGTPGTTFSFQVKYLSPNGAPLGVSLNLWRPDGTPVPGSPFALGPIGSISADYAVGVIYGLTLPLSAVGLFSYSFSATDTYGTAFLPSGGAKVNGPTVSGP